MIFLKFHLTKIPLPYATGNPACCNPQHRSCVDFSSVVIHEPTMARPEKLLKITLFVINTIWWFLSLAFLIWGIIYTPPNKLTATIIVLPLITTIGGFHGIDRDDTCLLTAYTIFMFLVFILGVIILAFDVSGALVWFVMFLALVSGTLSAILVTMVKKRNEGAPRAPDDVETTV